MGEGQQTSRAAQSFSIAAAAAFVLVMMAVGYRVIGLPPVVIVGGSGYLASRFQVLSQRTSMAVAVVAFA